MEPRVILTLEEAETVLKNIDKNSELYENIKEQILRGRGIWD